MKITFIRPNMFDTKSHDAMQPLAFSILAGLTPKDIEVEFFDDRIETLPEKFHTDLVAISIETFTARRAYQLAVQIRETGIPVIAGGVHTTFLPEEALRFCDSVVVGEAEEVWAQVIDDLRNKKLKKIYRQESRPSLEGICFDRRIFRHKRYAPIIPVQFGRGCRNACDFCSVHAFFGKSLRQRSADQVAKEIAAIHKKNFFIVDDNIFIDEQRTKLLLEAIIPLKIRWSSQASIDIANKPELLELMKKSGCTSLIIGFESMDERNLKQMKKGVNLNNIHYQKAIRKLSEYGIMVYGAFVIGYDFDTRDTFGHILEFVMENKLMIANFNPLIPMPGTPLYKRLREEGRLIYDKWWMDANYRYGQAVFRPKGMSPDELTEGCFRVRKKFYQYNSMMKRLWKGESNSSSLYNMGVFMIANLISKKEITKKQGAVLGRDLKSLTGEEGI